MEHAEKVMRDLDREYKEELKRQKEIYEKEICPMCKHVLYKRYEGLVCKNWKCKLYHKLGKGWILIEERKKDNLQYFKDKYDFDIERFGNKKRWLQLKSKVLFERGRKCEICDSNFLINIHHILPRAEYPELTFDGENLMVLCEECHKKIHGDDKYRYS